MSELKAFEVTRKALFGRTSTEKVYFKSEADAVIAELEESHKKEVEQFLILNREQANAANRLRDSMEQALRHHKYKRCLDQAKLCERLCFEFKDLFYSTSHEELEHAYNIRIEHYSKWNKRWLELAEKFKPNKE